MGGDRRLALFVRYHLPLFLEPSSHPDGKVWYFNPMAWQVVFYVGACCAVLGPELASARPLALAARSRWRCSLLLAVSGFMAAILALQFNRAAGAIGRRVIYPIDKTNIDILRFVHFLALAWLVRSVVPAEALFWRGGVRAIFADAGSNRCLYSV